MCRVSARSWPPSNIGVLSNIPVAWGLWFAALVFRNLFSYHNIPRSSQRLAYPTAFAQPPNRRLNVNVTTKNPEAHVSTPTRNSLHVISRSGYVLVDRFRTHDYFCTLAPPLLRSLQGNYQRMLRTVLLKSGPGPGNELRSQSEREYSPRQRVLRLDRHGGRWPAAGLGCI